MQATRLIRDIVFELRDRNCAETVRVRQMSWGFYSITAPVKATKPRASPNKSPLSIPAPAPEAAFEVVAEAAAEAEEDPVVTPAAAPDADDDIADVILALLEMVDEPDAKVVEFVVDLGGAIDPPVPARV